MCKGFRCGLLFCAIVLLFSCRSITAAAAEAPLDISAREYVLMEAATGKVLAGRGEHGKLPMASTTKIMTALLTLEQSDLDVFFTVDNDAIMVEGSSMGLLKDDEVSLRALSYGMLLASGNDAANLAAVKIGGTVENFVSLMNERAREIGMKNTNFVNPSGLHDEEHYSTPYDMALLAREALQNTEFSQICQQTKAKLSYGNPPYTRWLTNHNKLLGSYEGCIGLKTGFTKKAGRCLVSAAERDGITLICVTLNAPNDWQDHTRLLDYGFSTVQSIPLEPDLSGVSVPVVGGVADCVSVETVGELSAPLNEQELTQVKQQVLHPQFTYAPVNKGDVVGKVQYLLGEQVVAETDLLASDTVEEKIVPIEEKSLWRKIKAWFCEKRKWHGKVRSDPGV